MGLFVTSSTDLQRMLWRWGKTSSQQQFPVRNSLFWLHAIYDTLIEPWDHLKITWVVHTVLYLAFIHKGNYWFIKVDIFFWLLLPFRWNKTKHIAHISFASLIKTVPTIAPKPQRPSSVLDFCCVHFEVIGQIDFVYWDCNLQVLNQSGPPRHPTDW